MRADHPDRPQIPGTRGLRQMVFAAAVVALFGFAGLARAAENDPVGPLPSTAPATASQPAPPTIAAGESPPAGASADAPELMLFQDLPVVVAAGKREQTQQEAPASVSVVTDDDIQLFGYRNLADVLRDQRSFYLHTDGLNWFAGVRGFLRPGEWNSRLLVAVDGQPTNEVIYGQSHIDQDFPIPIDVMKQVEIVRGPGSALYGTNAVFGVVNAVTKDPSDINGIQATVWGGTNETGRANVLFGRTIGGWDVVADVSAYTSDGDHSIQYDGVNDAAHNFGRINGYDYEGVVSGFIKVHRGDFTLQGNLAAREKDNRSATYNASFFDPGNMYEQQADWVARVDHPVEDGQSFHARIAYGRYAYQQNWIYPPDGQGTPAYRYFTTAYDDWLDEQVYYDWQMTKSFHLLAGADARQAIDTLQKDRDTLNGPVLDLPASYNAFGVFAEGEWKATSWLRLTAGLRFDQIQRVGGTFSPRFAAVVTPDKPDTLKALYGRAFRAPNLYEQLYAAPGNTPNPSLKPEICDTFELVWERQFENGWRTTLDGFIWKMSDAMDNFILADGNLQTRNGPTLWAHGVEAEVGRQWNNGMRMRAYGSLTRAEHDDQHLAHSPEWILGTACAIPLFGRDTFVSFDPQVVGPMTNDLGESTRTTFVTNVVLTSRDLVKNWTFQAGVYNLFGNCARLPRDGPFNQFQHTLNWPEPMFMATISTRF